MVRIDEYMLQKMVYKIGITNMILQSVVRYMRLK